MNSGPDPITTADNLPGPEQPCTAPPAAPENSSPGAAAPDPELLALHQAASDLQEALRSKGLSFEADMAKTVWYRIGSRLSGR